MAYFKTRMFLIAASISCLGCFAAERFASSREEADIAAFASDNWQDRESAFKDLVSVSVSESRPNNFAPADSVVYLRKSNASDSDKLTVGLISLLNVENATVDSGIPLSQDYVDYYGDLIMAVSILEDKRAIPALLGAVKTGGMATDAIARLGDEALNATVDSLGRTKDIEARAGLAGVLQKMAVPGRASSFADPNSAPTLKSTLLRLSQDNEDPVVRRQALFGLGRYSDSDAQAVLKRLAESDNYSLSISGKTVFPLRIAAQKAIANQR